MSLSVLLIVLLLAAAWSAGPLKGSSSSGTTDSALVERTCEIARDISGDASDGVDTTFETRARFKDLYEGYGESVPGDLRAALRDVTAALTSGTTDDLEAAVSRLDTACEIRGF